MKTTKRMLSLIIVLALLFIAGCGGNGENATNASESESGEKITLRAATGLSAQHGWIEELMVPWMERVEELTEGQVEFEIFTGIK